jgi:hypothetical protein
MDNQHENGAPILGTPLYRLANATNESGTSSVFAGDVRDCCVLVDTEISGRLAAQAIGPAGAVVVVQSKDLQLLVSSILNPHPISVESLATEATVEPEKKKK